MEAQAHLYDHCLNTANTDANQTLLHALMLAYAAIKIIRNNA